jgi:hypothetical protein
LKDTFLQRAVNSVEFIAAGRRTKVVSLTAAQSEAAYSTWTYYPASMSWKSTGTGSGAQGKLVVDLDLPTNGFLRSVTLYVIAAGSHAGLPSTMPKLTLMHKAMSLGTVVIDGTANDTSINVAAFEAAHTIALSGLTVALNATDRYAVALETEQGTNALTNFELKGITYTFTEL